MAITSGQDDDPELSEAPAEGYVAYELHLWARESRLMIQQLLEATEVPYAWEGTDLVAPAVFERQIDELVERVEATAKPALDPEADKLLYGLGEWTDSQCLTLVQALEEAGIPYELDVEGDLVVLASDEEATEALLDSIEFPDALAVEDGPGGEPGDGGAAGTGDDPDDEHLEDVLRGRDPQEVLSDLFLSVDRLRRNANDHNGVLGAVDAGAAVAVMGLPFGFEPTVWSMLTEGTAALLEALEQEDGDDDQIVEQADQLRQLLRTLV